MSMRLVFVSAVSVLTLAACATKQQNPFYKYSTTYKGDAPTTMVASAPTTITTTPVSYEGGQVEVYNASTPVAAPAQSNVVYASSPSADANLIHANASTAANGRYTQVDEQCLQAGAIVPCSPVEIPITQSYANVSQPYATEPALIMANNGASNTSTVTSSDAQYGGEFSGTPGYYAVSGNNDYLGSDEIEITEPSYAFTELEASPATPYAPTVIDANAQNIDMFADGFVSSDGAMLHHVVENDTLYSLARKTCTSVSEIQSMNSINSTFTIRLGDNMRLPASRC